MSDRDGDQGGASRLAPPIPPLLPGDPPLAILVDYDGTIAQTDVSDTILAEFLAGEWEADTAAYDAGLIGSRRLMDREIEMLAGVDPVAIGATAAAQPHDPGFGPFVHLARGAGIPVEVVSDGFGFFIASALERLGVGDLPIVTASTTFDDGRPRIDFPNGHPRCFVCGTCKRNRVLAHQAAGRAVVFVGDGESDRYAAAHAHVVFAKNSLERLCLDAGWPFHRWTAFVELSAWLQSTLEAWSEEAATLPGPVARPFVCGPEVWGDGRWDPLPPRR